MYVIKKIIVLKKQKQMQKEMNAYAKIYGIGKILEINIVLKKLSLNVLLKLILIRFIQQKSVLKINVLI